MAVDPVSLAISAAMTAINMAVTASQTIEGPRLKDTSATVADYGTPLNYFVGERVLSCPTFFSKPIMEVKKKRKGKGGKQVSYSGFGTWASHIADHAISGVLKIWFDNHLVYDATGSTEKIYPLGPDYELDSNMRIYLGGETQDPDPDMLAYIEARDGPGTCPAYRPTSYIYFENVPLEMLGNRFPNVMVLVSLENEPAHQHRFEFLGPLPTLTNSDTYDGGANSAPNIEVTFFSLPIVGTEFIHVDTTERGNEWDNGTDGFYEHASGAFSYYLNRDTLKLYVRFNEGFYAPGDFGIRVWTTGVGPAEDYPAWTVNHYINGELTPWTSVSGPNATAGSGHYGTPDFDDVLMIHNLSTAGW